MNTVNGATILDNVVKQLNMNLPGLVAGCAFWSPANIDATKAAYPNIRRARSGEKRGTVTEKGVQKGWGQIPS